MCTSLLLLHQLFVCSIAIPNPVCHSRGGRISGFLGSGQKYTEKVIWQSESWQFRQNEEIFDGWVKQRVSFSQMELNDYLTSFTIWHLIFDVWHKLKQTWAAMEQLGWLRTDPCTPEGFDKEVIEETQACISEPGSSTGSNAKGFKWATSGDWIRAIRSQSRSQRQMSKCSATPKSKIYIVCRNNSSNFWLFRSARISCWTGSVRRRVSHWSNCLNSLFFQNFSLKRVCA
jgi:hypothetical protein